MRTVYVVMENDFPAGVCSSVPCAESMIERRREHWRRQGVTIRIYLRWYEFEMDAGLEPEIDGVLAA